MQLLVATHGICTCTPTRLIHQPSIPCALPCPAEPTFGKGKIQSVFELADGSALFVTVAKYQTPGGSGELAVQCSSVRCYSVPAPFGLPAGGGLEHAAALGGASQLARPAVPALPSAQPRALHHTNSCRD